MGRLSASSEDLSWSVDGIEEVAELRGTVDRAGGFLVSHAGELMSREGHLTVERAQSAIELLHWFFGFLRGAWTGPVFVRGCDATITHWRQFASWKIDEPRTVSTWLPRVSPLDLTPLFQGFSALWSNANWRGVLKTALGWFVAANASRAPNETRLVMAQIAPDLLAWVWLVETRSAYRRSKFEKLGAAGRIRALLADRGIPPTVPEYVGSLTGTQLLFAGELALQYFELALLAICGYRGKYARRGWRGWRGADECPVPWHG